MAWLVVPLAMNVLAIIAALANVIKVTLQMANLVLVAFALVEVAWSAAVAHAYPVTVRARSALAKLLMPSPALEHLDVLPGMVMSWSCLTLTPTIWTALGLSQMVIFLPLSTSILNFVVTTSNLITIVQIIAVPIHFHHPYLAVVGFVSTVM
jgi:hypothetical protein